MKAKLNISNKLKTKVDLSLKTKILVGTSICFIVVASVFFAINNFGIQKQAEAANITSGTYTIGSSGCNYTTIKNALASIGTLTGPITFKLQSNYNGANEDLPIVFPAKAGASEQNRITIRPANGTTISLSKSSATSSIFKFEAAKYYTIDGCSEDDPTTRRLTIINTNSGGHTAAVWIKSNGLNNGCTNIIIKNCKIAAVKIVDTDLPTFGVFIGGTAIGDGSYNSDKMGADNDNISIINNKIYRSMFGIWAAGDNTGLADNLIISKNEIGGDNSSDYITLEGLDINNLNNAVVSENKIYNIISSIGSSNYYPIGMWGGTLKNTQITKNKFQTIQYSGSNNYSANGIELLNESESTNILIANNVISDLKGKSATTTSNSMSGIRIFDQTSGTGMDNLKIYYNSINFATGNTGKSCICSNIFIGDGATNVDIRNNALVNTMTVTTSNKIKKYAIYCNSSSSPFSNINYNNYYCPGGNIGYFSGAISTMDGWRNVTDDDLRSVSADPSFTSITDLSPNLSSNKAWYLHGNGCQIAEINSDIIGNARSISLAEGATDIGAYEFDHASLPAPPEIAGVGSITDNSTSTFKVGDMSVASIKWHGSSLPTSVSVKYYSGKNPPDFPVDEKYVNAYWDITPTGGAGFTYDITLKYDEAIFGNILDESNMSVAKKHDAEAWEIFDNCVIDIPNKTITFNGLSTFSLFTIKGGAGSHLPIALMSFTGKLDNKNVDLNWKTATEINNDYFTLERSTDCKTFEQIAKINGAGNSNMILKYDYADLNVAEVTKSTKLYYRLKQTDFDGKFTYSGIIAISLSEESAAPFELVSANPNPFQNDIFLSVSSISEGTAIIRLYDMNGKQVKDQEVEIMEGVNTITLSNNADLRKGTYMISVEMNKQRSKVMKVIKY
jgi:hypothetical protein